MKLRAIENLGRELRDLVLRLLREYSEAMVLAIVMALILRTFVFAAYRISNASMEPNLKLGDFILGYKLPFGFNVPLTEFHVGHAKPNRGDLVIFRCPDRPGQNCVKRVVGLPGDRIEMKGQRLIVNGEMAKYEEAQGTFSSVLNRQDRFLILDEKIGKVSRKILISESNPSTNYGPFIVPPGTFFALGDNRDYSQDSRHWGPISFKSIESRVFLVWLSIEWELNVDGTYESHMRWDRLFTWAR